MVSRISFHVLYGRFRLKLGVSHESAHVVVVMFDEIATKMSSDEHSSFPPTITNVIGTTHTLKLKSRAYYKHGTFENFTCWKIHPAEAMDESTGSRTVDAVTNPQTPLAEKIVRAPIYLYSFETLGGKEEEDLEDSDVEISPPADEGQKMAKLATILIERKRNGSWNDPTNNPSLANILYNFVIIQSNTIINRDGKVQSYCGLKLAYIVTPCPRTSVILGNTRIDLNQKAASTANHPFAYSEMRTACGWFTKWRLMRVGLELKSRGRANGVLPCFQLGYEGEASEETKLIKTFEHDQRAKAKTTPRKLVCDGSREENSDNCKISCSSKRLSNESSSMFRTRNRTRSSGKSQRSLSRSRASTHLRRSEKLENRRKSKAKLREERARSGGKIPEGMVVRSDTESEGGLEDSWEDLNKPYKRPKPTPFTTRITRFRMFRQTLSGAARKWFNNLDPKSMDNFEELRRLTSAAYFGLDARSWTSGTSQKLNDKIPKMIDEMLKRVRAFIRGEVIAKSVNFPPPSPRVRTPKKQNLNKFCDYQEDRGHNTNNCFHLKKQIEEVVASGKLNHLVKNIRRGNQRNGSQGRGGMKVINMSSLTDAPIILEGTIEGNHVRRIYVDGRSSSEIMYKHCFNSFNADFKSRVRKANAPLVGFSGETYHPLGLIDLRVTMGEPGKNKTVLLEFVVVKCR
nr:hypothetical protein [Tanacetum cinerariifolium]